MEVLNSIVTTPASKPAGVAVAYLAWNFPLLNVGFKLGPALASGCSLIIKPSTLSPLSTYMLGEIILEMQKFMELILIKKFLLIQEELKPFMWICLTQNQ